LESSIARVPHRIVLPKNAYQITAADAVKNHDAVAGYHSTKKLAEEAAWNFVKEKKPSFDLTVINPDIIIGPMIQPVPKPSSVNATTNFAVYSFINGTHKKIEGVTFPFYHFVCILPNHSPACPE
jgi:hypothetical protein